MSRYREPQSLSLWGMPSTNLVGLGDIPIWGVNPPFNAYVEQWRPLITQLAAGNYPVEFLLAWIDFESNGNACDYEMGTGKPEVGVFQLQYPDNIADAGSTIDALHPVPPCSDASSRYVSIDNFTRDQANEQVRSGLQYVQYCMDYVRQHSSQYGYPAWDESTADFWSLVKMVHVGPAALKSMLQQGAQVNATTWDDLVQNAQGVPSHWMDVATKVGLFGAGFQKAIYRQTWFLALVGVAALFAGYKLYQRYPKIPKIPILHS